MSKEATLPKEMVVQQVLSERLQELSEDLESLLDGDEPDPLTQLIFEMADTAVKAKDLDVYAKGEKGDMPLRANHKLTDQRIKAMAALVLEGHHRVRACELYGIPYQTYRHYLRNARNAMKKLKADETYEFTEYETQCLKFREALRKAEQLSEIKLIKQVQAGSSDDWRAAAHLLGRRFPERWGKDREATKVDVSGTINVQNTGVLAVAPVAGSIEEWQQSAHTQEVIDPSKVLTLPAPTEEEDDDDIDEDE